MSFPSPFLDDFTVCMLNRTNLKEEIMCDGSEMRPVFGQGWILYPNIASGALFPHLLTERSSAWAPKLGPVTGSLLNLGLKSQLKLTLGEDSEARLRNTTGTKKDQQLS